MFEGVIVLIVHMLVAGTAFIGLWLTGWLQELPPVFALAGVGLAFGLGSVGAVACMLVELRVRKTQGKPRPAPSAKTTGVSWLKINSTEAAPARNFKRQS